MCIIYFAPYTYFRPSIFSLSVVWMWLATGSLLTPGILSTTWFLLWEFLFCLPRFKWSLMRMSWELSFLCSWVQTRHDHSIETAVRYTTQNITTLRYIAFLCVTRQRNTLLNPTYLKPNCTALHYIMTTLCFTEPQRTTLHYTAQVHTTPHHSGNVIVHYSTSRLPTSHHTKLHSTSIPPLPILSLHITQHYVTPHHTTQHHTTSYCQWFEPMSVLSVRHVTSHHITPCHAIFHYTVGHATLCYPTPNQPHHTVNGFNSGVVTVLSVQHVTPHLFMSPYTTRRHATEHSNLLYFTTSHHPLARHTTPHHVTLRHDTPRYATPHSITLPLLSVQHVTPRLVMSPYATLRHATKHSNLLYFTTSHHPLARHTTPHHVTLRHDTPCYATLHYTSLKFFTEFVFIVVLRYSLVSVCCHLSTACPSYLPPRWLAIYWLCSCSPYSAWWVNVWAQSHPKWFKSNSIEFPNFVFVDPE